MRFSTLFACVAFALGCGDPDSWLLGAVADRIDPSDAACETPGIPDGLDCGDIAGAGRFRGAELRLGDDGVVEGRYIIVLLANAAFQATADWVASAGDSDRCSIVRPVSGTHVAGGERCEACDTELTLNLGAVDPARTDCPLDYVDDADARSEASEDIFFLGLERSGDGGAVGWGLDEIWAPHGVHTDDEVQVWSDGTCRWFGTAECF